MEYISDFLNNLILNQESSGFLGSKQEVVWGLKAAALGIAVMGVYFILTAFIPETWNTRKTKNTVGVNKTMFLLHGLVGLFFFLGAVALIVSGTAGHIESRQTVTIDVPLTGAVFAICNGFGMSGSFYILGLKNKHAKAAQALGISEYDYYNEYISKGKE